MIRDCLRSFLLFYLLRDESSRDRYLFLTGLAILDIH